MPKRTLRQQMLAHRRSLSHDSWLEASRHAQLNTLTLPEFSRAGCVALYSPVHNEIDTALILEAAFATGKRTLFPVVCGQDMVLRQVDHLKQLKRGCFGVLEPCGMSPDHLADEADLIIVPGVVFDPTGHRIGYGKGFYDRFLQSPGLRAALVGLCHDFQLIDQNLPADRHDIRMDIIVTEQRIICCGSNRRHPDGPDSYRGGC
ncbi:MAG: 5-formyltetrahydrofolate cyclo-ligase [Desulfuromonadales bacterium]|nr:5-formyltetrahydrofolate cyclo-ligase [Desulfuromonadales bacterium]